MNDRYFFIRDLAQVKDIYWPVCIYWEGKLWVKKGGFKWFFHHVSKLYYLSWDATTNTITFQNVEVGHKQSEDNYDEKEKLIYDVTFLEINEVTGDENL